MHTHRRNLFKSAGLLLAGLMAPAAAFARTGTIKGIAPNEAVIPLSRGKSIPVDIAPGDYLHDHIVYHRAKGDMYSALATKMYAESDLLRAMPWMEVAGGSFTYMAEGWLPGIAFHPSEVVSSTGIVNPPVERLKIVAGDVDVDKALVRVHGHAILVSTRERFIREQAYRLTDMLINGDAENPPKPGKAEGYYAPNFYRYPSNGLRKRVVGPQLINARGGLRRKMLDETIDATDGANYILMAVEMRQRLDDAGLLTSERKLGFHPEVPVRYHYTTADGETTVEVLTDYRVEGLPHILGFEEPRKTTSIYALNISKEGYCGLCNGVIEANDLGEVAEKPVYRTRVEWLATHGVMQGRAVTRLHSVRDAPVRA